MRNAYNDHLLLPTHSFTPPLIRPHQNVSTLGPLTRSVRFKSPLNPFRVILPSLARPDPKASEHERTRTNTNEYVIVNDATCHGSLPVRSVHSYRQLNSHSIRTTSRPQ